MNACFVYVLKSEKNGSLYIGVSVNVHSRLKRHNSGFVRSTKSRRPFRLLGRREFSSFAEARSTEVQLKRFKDPERVLAWLHGTGN